jgi:cytochrome o ubiquinol oxidase subunit 1
VGLIGMVVAFIRRANDDHIDYYVPASEVEQIETRYQQRIAAQG